jgi:DNA-binding SARP family transcriptional activator
MGRARLAGDAELDVRLLGPLEVLRGGSTVPLGGPKPRALLATLALEPGHVVSVDRLVESLWPGESPESAMHAVQVYVSQLRKTLGAATLARHAPGYVLEIDPEHVDSHRFIRLVDEGRELLAGGDPAAGASVLRDALELWRGPALSDFLYEPFAQTEIARLEELRTIALEERIEADLALGRHVELVAELEALVQTQPLRERPRAQLMLALYRSGRQADALAAYRAARETLVDELGIDPGPELKGIEAAILRQDESLLLPETAPVKQAMQFRRLVTILFVDVVESMALAEALDAEALGHVLHRYFETVSAVVTRHGGTVEKFAGDAVMAAFGIPVSHEDDALRAARAALDIKVGIAALNAQLVHDHGLGLEVRIGFETGEVVATPTDARQRLVTGEAVGIAARLEQAAGSDEIVVGQLAGRLIDHAATLEPLGELEIKGKRKPVRAYRLVELTPVSPAFESRLDAPLVGRKRELAALRRALKRAVDGASVRMSVVVGPPGVGKSRLAAELAGRAKGVTALFGRCLSYGDGITYWPLREVLERAPAGEERDALVAALEADTPPPAPEIAWSFRRLCEALAREQPLVLVLDDVHWAEPTFLELVEQLVDKGEGPILVLCVARDELLEDRPGFLAERANAERIALDSLSADEADTLLEALGAASLESDQRGRVVQAAEGNPFFLEQLLALAFEGGLAEGALPETVQALLAARLDRLGPGERAVLERGAVIGKEFLLDDVVALLEPEAAPTAEVHMQSLVARGFVRPAQGDLFRFRHVLVQEAVYRAAPKRLRAELHERFTDRFEERHDGSGDVDEFAGYHLEQAYRLRAELGESDRRTERLAEDAGRRLGEAGIRALKRGDMPATVSLLGRATALLPADQPLRRELMCELSIGLRASGDSEEARRVLERVISDSNKVADRRTASRASIESAYVRLMSESGTTADALLEAADEGTPLFEAVGDDRSLARAWLLSGFVEGAIRGRYGSWEAAAERALAHYRRAGWPTSTCLREIAAALYYGPTAVREAVGRCRELLNDTGLDRIGEANVQVYMGGLEAQSDRVSEARNHVARARATFRELGQSNAGDLYCDSVLADIEMLVGSRADAESTLLRLCEFLIRTGDSNHLATRAADLADVFFLNEQVEDAERWATVSEQNAALDDVGAQASWRTVRAKLLACTGRGSEVRRLVEEAVELSSGTDSLNRVAYVLANAGHALLLSGEPDQGQALMSEALSYYRKKGNVAAVRRRRVNHDPALVRSIAAE